MTWTRTFPAPAEAAQGQRATMPRLLRLPAVEALTGLKDSAIHKQMRLGSFPRPVKITGHAVAWREDHLIDWLASREAVTENTLPPAA